MAVAGISDALFQAARIRMNYTWDLDKQTELNIRNALEEAMAYLRSHAGAPELSFESGELRGLLLDCAWYFINKKRAEFGEAYAAELLALRLMEGFGCGRGDSGEV